jgi:hypothetical protein
MTCTKVRADVEKVYDQLHQHFVGVLVGLVLMFTYAAIFVAYTSSLS